CFRALFLRVKSTGNIREYIMEMSNLAAKLKSLKLELDRALGFDLTSYTIWAIQSYNTQKDKWSFNKFICHCVQDEESLKRHKTESTLRKLGVERAKDVLELIQIDICGSFLIASWNGQQYFITFIDDYSMYNYLYLIHKKSQSVDIFKSFKAEVELQLGKKIKVVKSDYGGECYGRYDGSGE
ncbi:hypothetical protein CR513_32923, partial [Mucuna pruriens]